MERLFKKYIFLFCSVHQWAVAYVVDGVLFWLCFFPTSHYHTVFIFNKYIERKYEHSFFFLNKPLLHYLTIGSQFVEQAVLFIKPS